VLLEDDAANQLTILLGYTIVGTFPERDVTDADVDSEALVRYVDATGATNTNEPIEVSIEELAESPAPQPHVIRATFRVVGSGWDHTALVLDGTFCEWRALLC
jgi:hypothetical protein